MLNLSLPDVLYLQNRVAYTRDEHAYRQLFLHFHAPLFRFAFHTVKQEEVAEEIVSDVMMKIWTMGSQLAQVDKLNLYLFTAVKNTAFNYLAVRKPDTTEIDSQLENSLEHPGLTPETQLLLSEIQQHIEAAVLSLPRQCQLVYRLIKDEGFSHKEAGKIAGVSVNTIETQMRIALRKVRLSLDRYLHHIK